ncbi:hypothetical protein Mal64_23130 [Pseudobythopirellula maris]|uniref:DUF1559 domain-containing protein n=1 Tax=Pseudobythopirellula maris TaxID=2527991 RepID=A0A5C5ZP04_9BACT|nr:DUF1559 domain-containing protein [Pseudobythopirellula maris]TWT88825.1 hypothetical protein Mal64_23130 [Pseudobythopirellula maris]
MRFRIPTLLWTTALIAASLAAFGTVGVLVAAFVVAYWTYHSRRAWRSRMRASLAPLVQIPILLLLIILFVSPLGNVKLTVQRSVSRNHCKQIALALLLFNEDHGELPPAYFLDASGNPAHSWRVLILPYLDEQALYDAYDFDEPWDGPNNIKLLQSMPRVYGDPNFAGDKALDTHTAFLAITGEGAAFPGQQPMKYSDIVDGPANTALFIEARGHAVPWTQPQDLDLEQAAKILSDPRARRESASNVGYFSRSYWLGEGIVCFADGHQARTGALTHEKARALLTVAGDEEADDNPRGSYSNWWVSQRHWRNILSFGLFTLIALLPLGSIVFPPPDGVKVGDDSSSQN